MLEAAIRTQIVDELRDAYRYHRRIPALSTRFPGIEVEDAYRIQEEFLRHRIAAGRRISGYKVGLTSKVMQDLAGTREPDFSAMTDAHFLTGREPLAYGDFFRPLVEIEIAFVLGTALCGPGITPGDVLLATRSVQAAIEIVDSRIEPSAATNVIDTIADLAACGGAILGPTRKRLDEIDIRNVRGAIVRNGITEQEGSSSAVLGDPVNAIVWLANKLGEFGVTCAAGQVLLSGSFVRAMPVNAGDSIVCRFDNGLGNIAIAFA